jgi:hypothetical protein
MAKKKMSAREAKGRPKSVGPTRTVYTQIRSTPEWKGWLEVFAREANFTVTDLINQALILMAKHYQRPGPPRR